MSTSICRGTEQTNSPEGRLDLAVDERGSKPPLATDIFPSRHLSQGNNAGRKKLTKTHLRPAPTMWVQDVRAPARACGGGGGAVGGGASHGGGRRAQVRRPAERCREELKVLRLGTDGLVVCQLD